MHLGQEDLADADLAAIKAAGVRLGMSTHSPEELEIALAAKPDYIALGPDLGNQAQGDEVGAAGPRADRRMEAADGRAFPLVAIAGITVERAPLVLAAAPTASP